MILQGIFFRPTGPYWWMADGIKGLDTVIGEKFPGTPLQRCVTHLKRNMFAKVRHGDKAALAADLRF